jgi:hypothetical protein
MDMSSKKIFILNCLLFSFCFAYSQAISLPFYLDKKKRIIVEYNIKGENVKLLLDTGWEGDMIDVNLADRLNILPHKQNREIEQLVSSGEPYTEILPDNGSSNYIDTLFNYSWTLTNMKKTAKSLGIDDDVNGIVGVNFIGYKYVIEFDFNHNELKFWDSLPRNYLKNNKFFKSKILRLDYGQVDSLRNVGAMYPYIKGDLTILDTVKLHPLFFFDTGSVGYISLQVHDNTILQKMIDYKKAVSQKYGADYPTVHFQIPELKIDSLYANCGITRVMPDVFNLYKKNYFRVLLGMDFFLQYEKVLFDCKNRIGYFLKK